MLNFLLLSKCSLLQGNRPVQAEERALVGEKLFFFLKKKNKFSCCQTLWKRRDASASRAVRSHRSSCHIRRKRNIPFFFFFLAKDFSFVNASTNHVVNLEASPVSSEQYAMKTPARDYSSLSFPKGTNTTTADKIKQIHFQSYVIQIKEKNNNKPS